MRIHGLEARQGDTAFAFLVLRFTRPIDRAGLIAAIEHLAAMVGDADAFLAELPEEELDEPMELVGLPWIPPDEAAVAVQRRLLVTARGVEEVWCFQTGTSLPNVAGDEDADDDADLAAAEEYGAAERAFADAPSDDAGAEKDDDDDNDDDNDDEDEGDADDDDDAQWSHGVPPQLTTTRFPVDGYPAIVDELDWEDVGIAFKLAGPPVAGEGTVLLAFHALWLAPYGGRYRNAAVAEDRTHHAAHLWVDRFAVPCSAAEQVHHLLWIVSMIDKVLPVVHARFAGATLAQKYGGMMGDTTEPFVLGGNPLLAIHAAGGEAAVDHWLASQTEWSSEEAAQMLRELAIELVTAGAGDDDGDEEVDTGEITLGEAGQDDADDDDEGDGDRSRHITRHAGALLAARAAAGLLDPRVAATLRPVLGIPAKYEHRRAEVVEILGALRDRASVPALIQILETNPIKNALDSIGKEDFIATTARALGAIADPSAIPALSRVVSAPGDHNDEPRPVAAEALAACLAAAPEPRDVDDAVLASLLTAIRERSDGNLSAELHVAYGRIARTLTPARRAVAHQRLASTRPITEDAPAGLAREAALLLAGGEAPDATTTAAIRAALHGGLTELGYDDASTLRRIRITLRVAEAMPALVDSNDLLWLTRFADPDIRSRAHALLAGQGRPVPPAPVFDQRTARALDDDTLVARIGAPHVIGRAALVAEAARRELAAGRAAILKATHDVITSARPGHANLLDPDSRLLEVAVRALRDGPLDSDVIALFDRMLRHSNFHVKWELMQAPPRDPRLIEGMTCVLAEKWGWQEKTARRWLAELQSPPAIETEPVAEPDDTDVN